MNLTLEKLVSLAKRRGFVWQASEIYGGLSGFYNYGPYGVELMRNLKAKWWNDIVLANHEVVGLDSAILQHPKLWQASGHLDEFSDPMIECKNCQHRFRDDEVNAKMACPNCAAKDSLIKPRNFNLMFATNIGAVEDNVSKAYLRPETAGAIFTDFELVRAATRRKLPFGIAQIGKAFRNEISPRDFLFRMREFDQGELEYFVDPAEASKQFDRWLDFSEKWILSAGVDKGKLSRYTHSAKERSHYSAKTVDLLYQYPFGKKELMGVANRTDFDLKAQSKASDKDLIYYDQTTGKKFTPYIIEPSLGFDRLFLALLDSSYHEEEVKGEPRVVLRFTPELAPVKVAILPLSKNSKLSPLARSVYEKIKLEFATEYDETQSIGRRYRRQDEIGTPLAVTIDFESLKDKKVTIRSRDTMRQTRVKISDLTAHLKKQLS